jgi:hypothetical protein
MGFFGNLLGQAIGGGLGGLFGKKGRDIGSEIGGFGGKLLPFKRGGKIRMIGTMPQMRMGGKLRKGSAGMKRKMAMLRSMKK